MRTLPGCVVAMFFAACNGPALTDASSNDASSETLATDSSFDGDDRDAASADSSTGDGATCMPSDAGTLQQNYYCDLAIIHVIEYSSGPPRVIVQARVGSESVPCGAIDGVDVLYGEKILAHLGPSPSVTLGDQYADIATGEAPASLVSQCANETTRLSMYGLVIRGRDTNGPFEARCGRAEFGSRWPPGTSLACHRNIPRPPVGLGMHVMPAGGTEYAMLSLALPHASGMPVATRLDSTLRIVSPERPPFDPDPSLMSHDTGPWTSSVSESDSRFGPITQGSLSYAGSPMFDTSLCPSASMPDLMRPWFLARVTGQGPSGPITAEALTTCRTSGP